MVAFLNAGAEMLNVQANALHDEIACLELEVARKRKRLAELTKDGREGETAFLQDALALLHRKLIEYQEVARRLQVHNARTALFRMRIESGALNAALAFRHKVEADTGIAALRATDQAQRRELMADPRNRRSEKAPIALAEWRARSASARRQATRLKPRLGK
ncbi:MAG: hypothetical protein IT548_03390 [Alphaproteobacteria bacterium]|nr:hypothetical protein [Alphaproteobacteria bacterium]